MAYQFQLSPLIRYSLFSLYGSLTVPLPILMQHQHHSVGLTSLISLGLVVGLIALVGITDQRVELDDIAIRVYYPQWLPSWLQQGWTVEWSEVRDIIARSTSQGGLAYYLQTQGGNAYLLPMRVSGFRSLLKIMQTYLNIETDSIFPYVQPWMYGLVGIGSIFLWAFDLGLLRLYLISIHGSLEL